MNGTTIQPIPYQGSKRLLAPRILQEFPARFHRLVEPFAGSAAISIAVATQNRAEKFWINDAHKPLIALWREIIERPGELAGAYEKLWHAQTGRERVFYDEVRQRFNEVHQPADFLFLLARCVKAAIRYNGQGEFNNTPDNRRRGTRPEEMRRRILLASKLFSGRVKLSSLDYRDVLRQCKPGDLVYMDPPYQGVCGQRDQRYLPKVDHEEFCASLRELNRREICYVVSYDGRTGEKIYGEKLPESLDLCHMEICAGRSTQATLLGRDDVTYEALYLSPALVMQACPAEVETGNQLSLW